MRNKLIEEFINDLLEIKCIISPIRKNTKIDALIEKWESRKDRFFGETDEG